MTCTHSDEREVRNPETDLHRRPEVRRHLDREVLVRLPAQFAQLRIVRALVDDVPKNFLNVLGCAWSSAARPETDGDRNFARAAQGHLHACRVRE